MDEPVQRKPYVRKNRTVAGQRDVKFLKLLAKGVPPGVAAQMVAKDPTKPLATPHNSANDRMRQIAKRAPELMKKYGLGEKNLIEKHLKPLLEATEVKVFNGKEGILYSAPLPALDIRLRGLDMAFKIHGSYKQPEEHKDTNILNKIEVVIQDVSREDQYTVTANAGEAS